LGSHLGHDKRNIIVRIQIFKYRIDMSLISCPECKSQISSLAPNCPKCGCPVSGLGEATAAGTQIITTQQTAKKFKRHMLIGGALCCAGIVVIISKTENSLLGTGTFLIGLIWYLAARTRAWWNNG
jgi:hypothetical protein